MKIRVDMSTPLMGPRGNKLEGDGGEPFTVGEALLAPLMGSWREDKRTAKRKAQDVEVGMRIVQGGEVELSDEDRGHLRDVAFQTVPGAYLFVQICQALGFGTDEL